MPVRRPRREFPGRTVQAKGRSGHAIQGQRSGRGCWMGQLAWEPHSPLGQTRAALATWWRAIVGRAQPW